MTRKVFTLLCLLLAFMPDYAHSQDKKFLLSGSMGFSVNNNYYLSGIETTGSYSIFTINNNITFGYFLSDNSMIGGSINYEFTKSKNPNYIFVNSNSTSLTISPLYRNYFTTNLFLQLQANVGITIFNATDSEFGANKRGTLFGLGLGIGYSLKLGENIDVEPKLLYQANRYNESYNNSIDELRLLVVTEIGFTYRF